MANTDISIVLVENDKNDSKVPPVNNNNFLPQTNELQEHYLRFVGLGVIFVSMMLFMHYRKE